MITVTYDSAVLGEPRDHGGDQAEDKPDTQST